MRVVAFAGDCGSGTLRVRADGYRVAVVEGRRMRVVAAAVVGAFGLSVAAAVALEGRAAGGASGGACRPWVEVIRAPTSPNAVLSDLAVEPGGDVWAVGYEPSSGRSLVLRLHAGSVERVPSPSFSVDVGSELRAVVAPARDEVWAVGIDGILRWDGRRMRRVALGSYFGISASGPDNVWAVGVPAGDTGILVSHWDGHRWRGVPFLPIPGETWTSAPGLVEVSFASLDDVLALKTGVWVVGTTTQDFALTARWDGKRWRRYRVGGKFTRLDSLAALSESDVWAGGEYIAEWKAANWVLRGKYWRPKANDIVARRGELWAAIDDARLKKPYAVARWKGTRWAALEPRSADVMVKALAADPTGDVWAVAERLGDGVGQRPFFKHYHCP